MRMRYSGRMDINKLLHDVAEFDWQPLMAASTIDGKVSIFNDVVLSLYHKQPPIRRVKLKWPPV